MFFKLTTTEEYYNESEAIFLKDFGFKFEKIEELNVERKFFLTPERQGVVVEHDFQTAEELIEFFSDCKSNLRSCRGLIVSCDEVGHPTIEIYNTWRE